MKTIHVNIRLLYLGIVLSLFLPCCTAYAFDRVNNQGVSIYDSNEYSSIINEAENNVETTGNVQIKGAIPAANIPYNEFLQSEINNKIRTVFTDKLEYAKSNSARSISFRYEYKSYLSYGSILIYITTSLSQVKEEVVSVNFDLQKGSLMSISDLLGINATALINSVVYNEMLKAPDNYYVNFPGVKSNINFYTEDNIVCVLFDKYEIAPGSRGIISININLNYIVNLAIPRNDYLVKTSQYDLKMLPLFYTVCHLIGYSVEFNSFTQVIELTKDNVTIKCAVGENRYYKLGDPPKSLEAPPEMHDGVIYVPISFLDSILNVAYSVDSYENIILSYIIY